MHALSFADYADFLPLHFRQHHDRGADTALLDQYGRGSDHHTRRRAPDHSGAVMEFPRRGARVLKRLHHVFLGGGDLVDTSAADTRFLASRYQTLSATV